MRCERCNARIRGATWYCPSCGSPVGDLNVADSVNKSGLPGILKASLATSAVGLVLVMFLALIVFVRRGQSPSSNDWALDRQGTGITQAGDVQEGSEAVEEGVAGRSPSVSSTSESDPHEPDSNREPSAPDMGPEINGEVREGVPYWRIPQLQIVPNIDGDLSDWQLGADPHQPFLVGERGFRKRALDFG